MTAARHGAAQPSAAHLRARTRRDIHPTVVALLAVVLAGLGLAVETIPGSLAGLYLGLTLTAGSAVLAVLGRLRLLIRLATLAILCLCLTNLALRSRELQTQRQQLQQQVHAGVRDIKKELSHG